MATSIIKPPIAGALNLRLRNDLEIYPQVARARKIWVIKDPISLRYFRFREEEYEILKRLNGHSNLNQIKIEFEARFPPRRMTVARLNAFIAQLHRSGLVISDAPGQASQLLDRHTRHVRGTWISSLSNPLAIRFRGLDPEPVLRRLYPCLRWVFSPWCVAASTLLVVVAVCLVLGQLAVFLSRLPELDAFISAQNLVWLAVALGLTKLLHELGHALTCQHFGADCHEMGLMLLVFTPCLYCNVTDAWKLSNRWQRVAITAAGIYVEIVLASFCAMLWWFSLPGFINTACLNVMVVCSVGTIFLNGNPLLRYDGYYILSDLLEAPNLWRESRTCVGRCLSGLIWGIDSGKSATTENRSVLLSVYAIASMLYRVVVVVTVLYLVYRWLKPQGFLIVAQLLAISVILGVISPSCTAVWRTLRNPIMRRQIQPVRVYASMSVVIAGILFFFLVPLPCRITVTATVQPLEARRVYASVSGRLAQAVAAGEQVAAGDIIARLENTELHKELESVQGQVLRQQVRIRSLEALRSRQAELGAQLPTAKEILVDLEQRQSKLQRDLAALTLVAPVDGIVIPPPAVATDHDLDLLLDKWTGTPLDNFNLGCTLERRSLFCLIGQPQLYEAVLFVPEAETRYVREQQTVRMRFSVAPGQIVEGRIMDISLNALESRNRTRERNQEIVKRAENLPENHLGENLYRARVRLEGSQTRLLIGTTGWAKIRVAPQTLSRRVYRLLVSTFTPVL